MLNIEDLKKALQGAEQPQESPKASHQAERLELERQRLELAKERAKTQQEQARAREERQAEQNRREFRQYFYCFLFSCGTLAFSIIFLIIIMLKY